MTFISYEFFEYELQTTPVLRGSRFVESIFKEALL